MLVYVWEHSGKLYYTTLGEKAVTSFGWWEHAVRLPYAIRVRRKK